MTLYTGITNTSSVPPRIISVDGIGSIRPNDRLMFFDRKSTRSQSHCPNVAVLRVVHKQLESKLPFEQLLHTTHKNGRVATALGQKYFTWLEPILRTGLQSLGTKGILYAVFTSPGRIFRPSNYVYDDEQTWNPTQADYDAFDDWLYRCFGHDSERIVFAVVFDCQDGVEERRMESVIGTNYKAQQSSQKADQEYRKRLKQKAERLSVLGLNGREIHRYFERMLELWIPHETTIQDWAHKAGTAKHCGKRKLTKCKNTVHYMQDSLLVDSGVTPIFSGDKNDINVRRGLIHILTGSDRELSGNNVLGGIGVPPTYTTNAASTTSTTSTTNTATDTSTASGTNAASITANTNIASTYHQSWQSWQYHTPYSAAYQHILYPYHDLILYFNNTNEMELVEIEIPRLDE